MVQVWDVVLFLQLFLNTWLEKAQVFGIEELELVGDLVHLPLLL